MPFQVFIDDNFHYMDASARYALKTCATLAEAIEAAQLVVDEYLQSAYRPGMSADDLLTSYLSFGEDPFIVEIDATPSTAGDRRPFSARDYARIRIDAMCDQVEILPEFLSPPSDLPPSTPSEQ